jgi:hypothetical protein
MFVNAVIAVMSVAAVGFYLTFLVALFKECEPQVTGYWVRLRLGSCEDKVVELRARRQPATRAA